MPPFALAVSRALRDCGLPLSRVQARLAALGTPVSVATLSYWQNGRSRPSRKKSLRAVGNLEIITGARAGSLVELIDVPASDRVPVMLGGTWHSPFVTNALTALHLDYRAPVHITDLEADCVINPGNRCVSTRLTRTFEVESDAVARLPLMLSSSGRPAPTVAAVEGFRLGQEYRDHERGLAVVETVLPRPYEAGERFRMVVDIGWGGDDAHHTRFDWGLSRPAESLVIGLTFEGTPPASALGYRLAGAEQSGSPSLERPLEVVGHRVELRLDHPGAGIYGVRWSPYDDKPPGLAASGQSL